MTAVGRVQSEWTPKKGFIHFARELLRSYLNKFRKKIKFITYIYIIFLAYLGENFTLQVALRAGELYLDSLRAVTSSQQ